MFKLIIRIIKNYYLAMGLEEFVSPYRSFNIRIKCMILESKLLLACNSLTQPLKSLTQPLKSLTHSVNQRCNFLLP